MKIMFSLVFAALSMGLLALGPAAAAADDDASPAVAPVGPPDGGIPFDPAQRPPAATVPDGVPDGGAALDPAQRAAARAARKLQHDEALKAMVQTRLLQLFDANGDGVLDATEQAKADAFLQGLRGKQARSPLNDAIRARLMQRFGSGMGPLTATQLQRAQNAAAHCAAQQAQQASAAGGNVAANGGPRGGPGGPGGPGGGPPPGGPNGGPGGPGGGGPGGGPPGGFGGGPPGPPPGGGFGGGPRGGPRH